jgi:Glucose / Sorbosone dehydrogenase
LWSPLANRVYRYTWNGSALVSPSLILDLPVAPGPNHNGGTMTFGPDGKLYVVIGDLNHNGQLQNNFSGAAPDNTGVIFRINDDGSAPNDNPFFSQGGNLPKYYACGVRNSFGLAFDPFPECCGTVKTGQRATMRSIWSNRDSTAAGRRSWDPMRGIPRTSVIWFSSPALITRIPSSLGSTPSALRQSLL